MTRWMLMAMGMPAILCMAGAESFEAETYRRAIDQAVGKIGAEIAQAKLSDVKQLAVVPLRGDADDYATSCLKSALTKTPYGVYARDDDEWKQLLAEIEWGFTREDIMDAATVQKFGKIKGVDAIVYGRVWDRRVSLWSIRGYVKLAVSVADVETGRILWSANPPVEGEAFIHWSDALTQFWRFPLIVIGVLAAVVLLLLVLRAIRRAFRPL